MNKNDKVLNLLQLLSSLITFCLVLLMIKSAESLNVVQWVRMVIGIDQLNICVGLTALVKGLLV